MTEKSAAGHFRLPLDRAFTVKGFGTVVTGTLISGAVRKEQEVELYPAGRRLRVRGVQVYGATRRTGAGRPAHRAQSGGHRARRNWRAAWCWPRREYFATVTQVDCSLDLLPSAKPLKHRAPVHFHAGTAEIEARGAAARARPRCSRATRLGAHRAARAGAAAARRPLHHSHVFAGRDHRRRRGARYRRLRYRKARPRGGAAARTAPKRRRRTHRAAGARIAIRLGMAELVARTGLLESEIAAAGGNARRWSCSSSRSPGLRIAPGSRRRARSCCAPCASFIREPAAARHPQAGSARPRTAGFAAVPDRRAAGQAKEIAVEGENVRLATHKLVLKQDEEQARAAIERAFEQAGLAVRRCRKCWRNPAWKLRAPARCCRFCCAKSA